MRENEEKEKTCPVCGKPVFYAPYAPEDSSRYACSDIDCVNAHGIVDWGMPEEEEEMKDFTDAEWVGIKTYDKVESWEPKGELIILPGSKPIDIDAIQAKARLGDVLNIKYIELETK